MQKREELSRYDIDATLSEMMVGEVANSSITICNTGDTILNISVIQVEGNNANAFTIIEGEAPVELLPDSCITIKIRFAPNKQGNFMARQCPWYPELRSVLSCAQFVVSNTDISWVQF